MNIDTFLDPYYVDTLTKAVIALFLGGIVGFERDFSGHVAGLRTCMMIALASCMFTTLSVYFEAGDWRIAAQIVTGVGFLGAGAVLHQHNHVSGLTTAASIWLVAALGMMVGVGLFATATAVTLLAVLVLMLFNPLRDYRLQHAAKGAQTKTSRLQVSRPRVSRQAFKSKKVSRQR